MHARANGDAGVMVWLEFKKEGWLEKFSYAEFRIKDSDERHLVSAKLLPHPAKHGQSNDVVSVSFSADSKHLAQCSFLVVCYGSSEGDVGYYLHVNDFLDLANPITDK